MSNNVNAQNSHAMRNTTVQPSQLNGGNLSQMFDLQAMRVVKGRVQLNTHSAPQYYTVVDDSDGCPVTLGSTDFIIAYGVINGNSNSSSNDKSYNALDFISGLDNPNGVAIDSTGTYMYVANYGDGTISKVDLITRSVVNAAWVTGLSNPVDLVVNPIDNYIYVTNSGDNSISQIEVLTGVVVNRVCVTIDNPYGLVIDLNNNMYVTNPDGYISKLGISNGAIVIPEWMNLPDYYPSDSPICIDPTGTYIYMGDNSNGTILKLEVSTGSVVSLTWVTGLQFPSGIAIDPTGVYMYVTQVLGNNSISKIEISTGIVVRPNWVTGLIAPLGIAIDPNGIYMYVINRQTFFGSICNISKIEISTGIIVKPKFSIVILNLGFECSLCIDPNNTYMYVANRADNSISKIEISTGSVVSLNWVTGLNSPDEIVIDPTGVYMYILEASDQISKIEISTGIIVSPSWVTGLPGNNLVIDPTGAHMYGMADFFMDYYYIYKIEIVPPELNITNANFVTGLNYPLGLVIQSDKLYVANSGDNSISQIELSTGSIINPEWISGLNSPYGLAIDPNSTYMYVTNSANGVISQINLVDGAVNNLNWLTGLDNPSGVVIDLQNFYMYVANSGNVSSIVVNNKQYLTSTAALTPINNCPEIKFVINPLPPFWDTLTNLWTPQNPTGLAVQTITPVFTTGVPGEKGTYINSGYGNLSPVIRNSCAVTSWLQMIQTANSFTIENNAVNAGAINITLVILN